MTEPSWLPPLEDIEGSREDTVNRLYGIFVRDFRSDPGCRFRGVRVDVSRKILPGELHEEMFWHITSKERSEGTGTRSFDTCRARRIAWCRAIIENSEDDSVKVWRDKTRGRLRTYLWLETHDFVVILEEGTRKRIPAVFLVTAYCVEGESSRRKLRKSYRRRLT